MEAPVKSNIGEVHTEHGLLKGERYRYPYTKHCNGTYKLQTQIKGIQINLQHSRLATDNLRRIIGEDSTGILYIQEPYTIQNKISGLSKIYKDLASGVGKNCAATVVTNNQVDTLLIKQLSDKDIFVVAVIIGNVKIILATMYFDINREIEIDLVKIESNIIA